MGDPVLHSLNCPFKPLAFCWSVSLNSIIIVIIWAQQPQYWMADPVLHSLISGLPIAHSNPMHWDYKLSPSEWRFIQDWSAPNCLQPCKNCAFFNQICFKVTICLIVARHALHTFWYKAWLICFLDASKPNSGNSLPPAFTSPPPVTVDNSSCARWPTLESEWRWESPVSLFCHRLGRVFHFWILPAFPIFLHNWTLIQDLVQLALDWDGLVW